MVTVEPDAGAVDQFFAGTPLGKQVYAEIADVVDGLGPASVRVSRSQVSFRRRRAFCWVWLPGKYLSRPAAPVVVSVSLPRRDSSARWKQVVEPSPGRWLHHLEVQDAGDVDTEVTRWLIEAYASAA